MNSWSVKHLHNVSHDYLCSQDNVWFVNERKLILKFDCKDT